jgi:hypothetical protein
MTERELVDASRAQAMTGVGSAWAVIRMTVIGILPIGACTADVGCTIEARVIRHRLSEGVVDLELQPLGLTATHLDVEDVAARLNVTKGRVWEQSSRNTPYLPVIRLSDGVIRYCSSESGSLPAPNNKTVGAVWFRRQDYERSLEPVKRGVSICS